MPSVRRTRLPILLLSVLPFFASCAGDDQPGAPVISGPTAPSAVTGPGGVSTAQDSEKCYSVQFVASAPWGPGDLTFALDGDLIGTFRTEFDPSTIKYSGPMPFFSGGTMAIEGAGHWVVTGGIVPGLSAFRTSLTNRNLLSAVAGATPDVFENIGSHRAVTGVGKANLTYKGTASMAGVEHRYHGVICP
jgi:hypothetical protein